jgi:putative ABC transport system permease protein
VDELRGARQEPDVAWIVPLSIGDSHHGFPVVGTTSRYFDTYRYGLSQPLDVRRGRRFEGLFETVLGRRSPSG